MDRDVIEKAAEYVAALLGDDAGGHDADHALRVCRNALLIAKNEKECNREIVALAALLHDADDHKLFRTENNANAREFLALQRVDPETVDRICEVINSVSFSKNRGRVPVSAEGKVVQDADRLDALGAVGIARTFAYGGLHGRPLRDSIRHFHEKLLLLKDMMNTETGKQLAEERDSFLRAFLDRYDRETRERDERLDRKEGQDPAR